MSGCGGCCTPAAPAQDRRFRRALWIALAVNAAMFGIELVLGLLAGSVSLQADALDFLGDAANYALGLFLLGVGAAARARGALLKGLTMGGFGLYVLVSAGYRLAAGVPPHAALMGATAGLALAANVAVALMLYRFRGGDSNMRSVWLCSRNDAVANVAVMAAAAGVWGTASPWPDVAVAVLIAGLALWSAQQVVAQARQELRALRYPVAAPASPASARFKGRAAAPEGGP